jgi:hypothetical protein
VRNATGFLFRRPAEKAGVDHVLLFLLQGFFQPEAEASEREPSRLAEQRNHFREIAYSFAGGSQAERCSSTSFNFAFINILSI